SQSRVPSQRISPTQKRRPTKGIEVDAACCHVSARLTGNKLDPLLLHQHLERLRLDQSQVTANARALVVAFAVGVTIAFEADAGNRNSAASTPRSETHVDGCAKLAASGTYPRPV